MPIQYSTFHAEDGSAAVSVFVNGQLKSADDSHPNFDTIVALCAEPGTDPQEVLDLFDVAATVSRKFQQLTERVAVRNGVITLDGDPVHGTLQDQILDFVNSGDDFGPLVNFYERLATNPLGDVRDAIFDWIKGNDGVTITPEGNIIGYKGYSARASILRSDEAETVYVSSRPAHNGDLVNGVEVPAGSYAEHLPGDVVEMPRSVVLHEPSALCGVGLHIGTYTYAKSFGPVVMTVEFDPRDVVSVPDSNSGWKLRVCRYRIIEIVGERISAPVFGENVDTAGYDSDEDDDLDVALFDEEPQVGDTVEDEDGDEGVVTRIDSDGFVLVDYSDNEAEDGFTGTHDWDPDEAQEGLTVTKRKGYSGPTSQAAKGRGRNPAQDAKGQFSAGRPGSARNASTGRFA